MPRGIYLRKPHSEERKSKIKNSLKNSEKFQEHISKLHNLPRTQKQIDSSSKNGKRTVKIMNKLNGSGEAHPNFKGGLSVSKGYFHKYCPEHKFKNKRNRVKYSRWIVEQEIGRYLLSNEEVHHEDRNKLNDDVSNLIAFSSKSAHQRWHKNPNNVKFEEIIFDGRKKK